MSTQKNMFSLRNKKNMDTFWLKKAPYQELWFQIRYLSVPNSQNFAFSFSLAIVLCVVLEYC